MNVIMDIPVILNDIGYSDDYEGDLNNRRQIIWTLDLTVKGYLYGPIKKNGVIKFINVDFFIPEVPDGKLADAVGNTAMAAKMTIQPGLTEDGKPINYWGAANNTLGTVPYQEIEADNDYGFITQIYDIEELNEQ